MIRRIFTGLGAVFMLSIGASASATLQAQYQQPQQVAPEAQQETAMPELLAGPELWPVARCLAEQQSVWADALLISQPHSQAADAAIAALLGPTAATPCLADREYPAGGLAVDRRQLRGSLAQYLYLAEYPQGAPAVIASLQPAQIPVEEFNARMAGALDAADEAVRIFADCIVLNHAMTVDGLVRSAAGSAEEGAALAVISPSMNSCLWEGRSISFTTEMLRAALADGLYRKAEAIPAFTPAPVQEEAGR